MNRDQKREAPVNMRKGLQINRGWKPRRRFQDLPSVVIRGAAFLILFVTLPEQDLERVMLGMGISLTRLTASQENHRLLSNKGYHRLWVGMGG